MRFLNYLYSLLFIIYFIVCCNTASYSQNNNEITNKFNRVIDYINSYYVDTVNQNKLVEYAIIEVLKKLDPHSIYINKDEVREMNEPLEGSFEGIGIQYNIVNDTIMVIEPIAGGPSEKVGILAGDKIVQIDGTNVASIGIKNSDIIKKLRGAKGTKVNILIKRRREKKLLDFTVERDKIPIFSIDATYMVDKTIGYIRLTRFSATTMNEFYKAIENLKKQGMKKLILDLQNNSGGYLNVAVELADQFIEGNKIIVYTEGVNNPKSEYKTSNKGVFKKGELVILVDENSASASEIVSGAIQDWDRGLIIGRRTFGKGLVQRPFTLQDGSMIRLTIARYYTPTGRLIQKSYKNGYFEYSKDIINRYNNGELSNSDSIHFPDSLKKETLINKRIVYGGGGIMPDIFVPIDTSYYSDWGRQLFRKGTLYKFILNYIDINRANLKSKYPAFNIYNEQFIVTDSILTALVQEAEKDKIKKDDKAFEGSKEHLRILIKAYIADNLFTSSEKVQIQNQYSEEFKMAVEVLKDKNLYNKKLKNIK